MSILDEADELRKLRDECCNGWHTDRGARDPRCPACGEPGGEGRACEHGKRPWWDCADCRASSRYGFSGNFR